MIHFNEENLQLLCDQVFGEVRFEPFVAVCKVNFCKKG